VRRWQKYDDGVSGYAPIYKNWRKKDEYEPLTKRHIESHLLGRTTLGVYPLLEDNTSHFIVVDFDGEGADVPSLDCLFLAFPFSFEGKLVQYIGRIQRGESRMRKVYDYRDGKIELLDRMFKKRQRYYNKLKKN